MITGQGISRVDGPAKVTGRAQYAAEFALPGMVHAVLVQSTVAAGRIAGFDLAGAQGMPGVLAIITHENAERLTDTKAVQQTVTKPLLQGADIWYNGQHVAVVVADTLDRATAAAAAVRVRYEQTEATTVMDPALDQAYTPKHFRDGAESPDYSRGTPDDAFNAAAVKVAQTYRTPIEHHNPMEPHATLAEWKDGRLTVWTSSQGIGGAQRTLSALFGIDADKVSVHCPFVGGGFGCKGNTWPPATLAAMAARHVNRPVRLVLEREQMFYSNGYRPRTVQKVRVAAQADGTLVAVRHDGITQNCQPVVGEFAEPVALATEMLYSCPNLAVTHRLVAVNQGLPTYMRAPGESSGVFAIESAMDELAFALKMDPIALRLKNHSERDAHSDKPFTVKRLRECYAQGAAAFGWDRRTPAPRSMRDGHVLIGMGMATSTYPTNRRPAQARVRLLPDGSAVVQSGTQDLGTGTYTIMAQVAADELGLPIGKVVPQLGSTDFPPAPVSGGSTTAASVMPAVQAAARAARTQLFGLAIARVPGWNALQPDQLTLRDGAVQGPAGSQPVSAILAAANRPFLEAESGAKPGPEYDAHSRHAWGAQFAEVRVDPDFGTIRVSRLVGAFDAGRILNAKTAHSQMIGGMVFGLGMALLEETVVDPATGRYTNANVSEYVLPVNADIPEITAIAVQSDDQVTDPLGAKGVGELPMVGVAPAIANAVFHATGVRVRSLPIRVEDVLA